MDGGKGAVVRRKQPGSQSDAGKVRRTPRAEARLYLAKAHQHLKHARDALAEGAWDTAALLAIQVGVNAVDAACVWKAELRAAGQAHTDAVRVLQRAFGDDDRAVRVAGHLRALADKKNIVGYESRLTSEAETTSAVKRAERVLEWVADLLSVEPRS